MRDPCSLQCILSVQFGLGHFFPYIGRSKLRHPPSVFRRSKFPGFPPSLAERRYELRTTMDPLTAVSLVGTILQFIDFGVKLFSEGKELYHSTTGALEDNIRITDVTSDLRDLCIPLQRASLPYYNGARGIAQVHQNALQKLATSCIQVADKLMPILEGLQIPLNTTHKTWHVIRQSIRGAMRKEEITQLRSTLTMLQQQL